MYGKRLFSSADNCRKDLRCGYSKLAPAAIGYSLSSYVITTEHGQKAQG